MLKISETMKNYFKSIEEEIEKLYKVASEARKKGLDPKLETEIPPAKDVAARVEGLIGPKGVAERIRELTKEFSREEVAFKTADEIISGKFGKYETEESADLAIRAALAILTEGITAGPIEGIANIKIKDNFDGTKYLAIYFAGPIRAAGGTEAAQTVIVGDFVRKKLGLDKYKPINEEIERYVEEIDIYDKIMNLQYPSTPSERREAIKNIPIEITGEATEKEEVKGFRDLTRVETNRVRGGAVLVLNDGVLSKAPKLVKIVQNMGIEGWSWLKTIKKTKEENKSAIKITEITPNRKYISDVIAGRPVFSHPSAIGGFRLRYGRSRNTGLAGSGLNPATMYVLDNFLAPGTHIRTERPGKGSIVMPVDSICGPTVLLRNGAVLRINTVEEAKKYNKSIKKILFLGDLLLGYGEFLENNHPLITSGYVPEWWSQELKLKIKNDFDNNYDEAAVHSGIIKNKLIEFTEKPLKHELTGKEAVILSKKFSIPLHPYYTYHWHDIKPIDVQKLHNLFRNKRKDSESEFDLKIKIENNPELKQILEEICLPHIVEDNKIIIEEHSIPFLESLGIGDKNLKEIKSLEIENLKDGLEAVNKISPFTIKAKVAYYIGARMGRPEKAKPRSMSPPVHSLFPIGLAGGPRRSIIKAQENKIISTEIANIKCPKCGKDVVWSTCDNCGELTIMLYYCVNCNLETPLEKCPKCKTQTKPYQTKTIDIQNLYQRALRTLELSTNQDVKCVRGMISQTKYPEPLEKGILRSKYSLYVYKDGTIRYDMTDSPLTHIKPREIKAPIAKLKSLGYTHDIKGEPLENEEQILELKPQDIVIPHNAAQYLIKTSQFIDELLQKFYHLKPYYNIKQEQDLIGHLIMGLAPHTSAAIIGRIIGFTTANMCYAHPLWHAAKRRNCLSGEEHIPLYNIKTNEVTIKPIKEIIEKEIEKGVKTKQVDNFGTREIKNSNPYLRAISLNSQKNQFVLQPIKHWIKGQNNQWVIIKTISGRTLKMTPEHNILTYNLYERKYETKKARELQEGNLIPIPSYIRFPIKEPPLKINILEELSKKLPANKKFDNFKDQVRLRKAKFWMKQKLLNYVSKNFEQKLSKTNYTRIPSYISAYLALKINNQSPRPFSYSWYDSIPLSHLEILNKEGIFEWNEIPEESRLGMARDDHSINPYIIFSSDLIRLIGYYVSEGFTRDNYSCYQMNIAAPNPGLREHIKKLISESLGVKPIHDKKNNQLITCGRIHSYLMCYAWKAGKNAYLKRIPNFIFTLPEEYRLEFLSAFIDGDGSIPKTDNCILFYSVSKKLLNDIGFLLNSLNVQFRMRKSSPKAHFGKKIIERYEQLKKKPKESIVHRMAIRGPDLKILEKLTLKLKTKKENANKILINGYNKDLYFSYKKKRFHAISKGDVLFDKIIKIKIQNGCEEAYCLEILDKFQCDIVNNFIISNCITKNCDSDEDSILLALDALLNFSKLFLPEKRGGMMDAPLVVSVSLNPFEVDDEAWNVDVGWFYPLEFYEATERLADPKELANKLEVFEAKLGSDNVFEGVGFTHDTSDINVGPENTAYKMLASIPDKVKAQLSLAEKICAVDEADVALRVLNSHFIPDIIGNLGAFTKQQFRCQKCNKKFRRVPLSGVCSKKNCGGKILPTVYKGGIEKYLEVAESIISKYHLPRYLSDRLEIIRMNIESLFENDKIKQPRLSQYF